MLIPLHELLARHGHRIPPITGVLHLGGHVGEEADAYAQCLGAVGSGPDANCWWVEGNPDLMSALGAHVEPYGHYAINALVGAEDGCAVDFHVADNGQSSSVLALGTHAIVSPDVHYVGLQRHMMRTVDSLVAEYGITGVNMINADLQGYELEALKGAEVLLKDCALLYLEVNVDELYQGCARLPDLDAWLCARGFERVEIAMAGDAGWGDACWVKA